MEILSHYTSTEFLLSLSLSLPPPAPPCPVWLLISVVMTHSRILGHHHSSPRLMCRSRVLLTGSLTGLQFISSPLARAHICELWVSILLPEPHFEMRQDCPSPALSPRRESQAARPALMSVYQVNIQRIEAREGDTEEGFRDGASLVKQRMGCKVSHSKRTSQEAMTELQWQVLI